jgi:general secretion pathway protein B
VSYILDALRKSDQQRQRGLAPALHIDHLATRSFRRSPLLVYGVPALILVGAGVLIGWWRPWEIQQPVPVADPLATKRAESTQHHIATPLPTQSVLTQNTPEHANAEPRSVDAATTEAAIPALATPPARAVPAGVVMDSKVLAISELPAAIQQEIPAMNISVHAYSPHPANRMVGINNQLLREGGNLPPGLTLNEITPDGMVFSYKGYRFRRAMGSADSR